MKKPKITSNELTRLVNEEAKKMVDNINKEGFSRTFNECKKDARAILLSEYEIIK